MSRMPMAATTSGADATGGPGAGTAPAPGGSLAAHARRFVGHLTPKVVAGLVVGFAAVRSALGPLRWSDLAVGLALVAADPFLEWLIHVFVLHARPRTFRGLTIDLSPARGHRAHHLAPNDLEQVFLPGWALLYVAPVLTVAAFLIVRPWHLAATGLLTSAILLLAYEWTHYLVHTTYRPRSRWYRGLWRHHRLHHFRNENYWFGVTSTLGDRALRTRPGRGDVPASSTARTLGRQA